LNIRTKQKLEVYPIPSLRRFTAKCESSLLTAY
jgi:hypothetical protein